MATLKQAIADSGKVTSGNGKMPGTSYPLSARRCITGDRLAAIEGSVCASCYARRLEAFRPSVHAGWESNYRRAVFMIEHAPARWAEACAWQIRRAVDKGAQPYHRWFDSGDLQSVAMLACIVRVCELTLSVRHWLPTREAGFVKAYLAEHGAFPENLVVRVSSTMVGDLPRGGYLHTSTVHSERKRDGFSKDRPQAYVGERCGAGDRGHQCGPCRLCWDETVETVSYPLH